jgi:hypothetical protein
MAENYETSHILIPLRVPVENKTYKVLAKQEEIPFVAVSNFIVIQ